MQEIREILKSAVKELYGIECEPEIVVAPETIGADYSSNISLKIVKEIHKKPIEIGEEIVKKIKIKAFVTPPGFINFTLSDEYLSEGIGKLSDNFDAYVKDGELGGKTVVCEFSDPNPFKVLHVGHLYTSVVGDAISRLFEYAGAKVVRANFGGDVGLHVAKTMYVLRQKDIDDLQIEDIAKCYIEGTAAYEEDEKAREEITKLNKEIYKINAEDVHGTELSDLYWKARELSYKYFEEFYARIGVKFDKYYPESSVAELGLKIVKEQLEKGVYEESEGAVIFDGEKYGLHTRVFINKEGVPTYETKDVGLIFTKWEDWHFDKSVVITGSEQLDYMKVVLKSVKQYAPELVERTSHLTHGLVKLPGGVKMSSRKGNFLRAVEVLEMVAKELKEQYDSDDRKVALAALRYAFLKYKMGGNIIFDPRESVKMTGNSGPYLLYSCVRAKHILASVKMLSRNAPSRLSLQGSVAPYLARRQICSSKAFFTDAERNLAKKTLEYREVLGEAVMEMAPHKITGYLYELAQEFSRFYEKCPVVGDAHEMERAELVKVYLDTMTHGLDILGIEIPERM